MEEEKQEQKNDLQQQIQEKVTFYYSNFDLFDESSKLLFTKYQMFKNKLHLSLGYDWDIFANIMLYSEIGSQKVFFDSKLIFNIALEAWLELRRDFNYQQVQMTNENTHSELEMFQSRLLNNFRNLQIEVLIFKAVSQAFHITAIQIWEMLISQNQLFNFEMEEEDQQIFDEYYSTDGSEKDNGSDFSQKKRKSLPNFQGQRVRPLLIASETIKNFLLSASTIPQDLSKLSLENEAQSDIKNFSIFHDNIQQETGKDYEQKLQNLLNQKRQMRVDLLQSDPKLLDMQNNQMYQQAKFKVQKERFIEIKKMTQNDEQILNKTLVNQMFGAFNKLVTNSHNKWRVTQGLVTTVVQVNYNKLMKLENSLYNKASNFGKKIKIRFLQPASNFYNQLMDTWLISKLANLQREVTLPEFMTKVQSSFGNSWDEALMAPTSNFFGTLQDEWGKIKLEEDSEENYEERIKFFVRRVRQNMVNYNSNISKLVLNLRRKYCEESN